MRGIGIVRGVIVGHLKPNEVQILDEVLSRHEIEVDAFARFWDHTRLQLDGDLSLKEMQALTEAMQLMADEFEAND